MTYVPRFTCARCGHEFLGDRRPFFIGDRRPPFETCRMLYNDHCPRCGRLGTTFRHTGIDQYAVVEMLAHEAQCRSTPPQERQAQARWASSGQVGYGWGV